MNIKRIGITIGALALAALTPMQAQTYSEAKSQRVAWGKEIGWKDFAGRAPSGDTTLYKLGVVSESKVTNVKVGNTRYYYYWPKTYVEPDQSWCKEKNRSPELLKLCQTQFDLWELMARKGMIEYNSTPTYLDWNEMSNYYSDLYNRRKEALWEESEHGKYQNYVEGYDAIVRAELETLSFDPTLTYDTLHYSSGAFIALGVKCHVPMTDYTSVGVAFDMQAGFLSKSSIYGLDFSVGYAKCRKTIYESDGEIAEGDGMAAGSMGLFYGRVLKQNKWLMMAPYARMGVNFYTGGEKYEWGEDENKYAEKAGFCFGLGMMIDIPLRRTVRIKTEDDWVHNHTQSLHIKPYFGGTKYHGEMGLVPEFSITVGWEMGNLQW